MRLRSPWRFVMAACFMVWAWLASAFLAESTSGLAAAAWAVPTVVALGLAVRSLRQGVVLRGDAVVERGPFRTRRVPVDDVESVTAMLDPAKAGAQVWTPVLVLGSGEVVRLRSVAAYGRREGPPSGVLRDTAAVADFLRGSLGPEDD